MKFFCRCEIFHVDETFLNLDEIIFKRDENIILSELKILKDETFYK